MSALTPRQVTESYSLAGVHKARRPAAATVTVGAMGGAIIGLAGAVTNTASHSLGSVSAIRMASGLLFPFGLAIVILLGAELFTGNVLLLLSALDRRIRTVEMLRNLMLVYIGNWIGGALVAAGCAFSGQLGYSNGGLAVYTIKTAVGKCALSPGKAVIMGVFCNVLVCTGVLLAMCANDVTGKITGAYIPVAFFVLCGFEHCVANMYYIPAGLFAMQIPGYAAKAAEYGLDTSALTWGNYFARNLLPVTAGNFLGGAMLALFMWGCHRVRQRASAVN